MFTSKNNILRRTASLALAASMVFQSVTPYYASEPATEVATEAPAPATEAQTQPETPAPQPETPAPQPETPAPQPETPAPQPETAAPQPEATTPEAPAPETKVEATTEAPATEKQTEKVTEKATEKQTEKATEKQTEAPKYTLTLPVLEEVSYDYDKDHKDDKSSNDKKVVLVYLEDEKVEFSITTEKYTYTIIEDRNDDQENTIKSYEDVKNRNEAKATYEFKMPAKDLIIKYVEIPEEETEIETDTEKKIETQELTESQGTEEATEAVSEETETEAVTEAATEEVATEAITEDTFVESNESALTETEAISEETETEYLTEETEAETEAITEVPTEDTTESEEEEERPEGTFAVYYTTEVDEFTTTVEKRYYAPGEEVDLSFLAKGENHFTDEDLEELPEEEVEDNLINLQATAAIGCDSLEATAIAEDYELSNNDTQAATSFEMPEEDVFIDTEYLATASKTKKKKFTNLDGTEISKGIWIKWSGINNKGTKPTKSKQGWYKGDDMGITTNHPGAHFYWIQLPSLGIGGDGNGNAVNKESAWVVAYCVQAFSHDPTYTHGAKLFDDQGGRLDDASGYKDKNGTALTRYQVMCAVYYYGTYQISRKECYWETSTGKSQISACSGSGSTAAKRIAVTHFALSDIYAKGDDKTMKYTTAGKAAKNGLISYALSKVSLNTDTGNVRIGDDGADLQGYVLDMGKVSTDDGDSFSGDLQNVMVLKTTTNTQAYLYLTKASTVPLPANNPNYTLAGAKFQLWAMPEDASDEEESGGSGTDTNTEDPSLYTQLLGTATSGADGKIASWADAGQGVELLSGGILKLDADDVMIKETAVPKNMLFDQNAKNGVFVHDLSDDESDPTDFKISNPPVLMAVRFAKRAATPQNDRYIYAGAVYNVKGASEAAGRNVTTVQNAYGYDGYAEARDLWIDDYTITEVTPSINFDVNGTAVAYWASTDINNWVAAGWTEDGPDPSQAMWLCPILDFGIHRSVYEPEKWAQLGIQKINKRKGTNLNETDDYSLAGATYKVYSISKALYETGTRDVNAIINAQGTAEACYYYDTDGTQGTKVVSQTPIYITTDDTGYAETAGEADTSHRLDRGWYALIEVETSTNMLIGEPVLIDASGEAATGTPNSTPTFIHCGATKVGMGQAAPGQYTSAEPERYVQFFIQKIDWMSNLARNPIAADFTSKIWTKDGDQNGIVENDNYSLENAVFDVYKVPFGQEDAWLNNANFFKECDQATAASFRAQAQGLPKAYYYADNNPNPTSEAVVLTTNAKGQAHTKYDASHRLLCGVYVIVEREDSMNYTLGAPVIIDARRETERTSPEHNVEQPLNNPDGSDASVPQLRLYKAWGEEGATESTDGAVPTGQFPESGYNTYTVAPIRQYPRPVQLKIQKVDKRTKLASVPVDNGEYSLANAKFRVYAIKPEVLPRGDGKGSDENLTEAILRQIASPAHYITDKGEDNGEVIITTDANGVAQTLDDPNHRLLAGCYAICEFEESKGFRLGKVVTIDARRENWGGAGDGDASSGQEGTNKTGTRLYGPQTPQGNLYVKGTQGKYEVPAVYEPERWGYIHLIKYDGDSKTKQQYFGYSNYGSYAHSQSGSNIEPSQGDGRDANVNQRSGIFVEYEQGTPQYLSMAGATYIASFGSGFGSMSGTTAKSIDQLPNTDEYLDRLTNDGFLVYPAPYFVIGGKTVGINKAVQAHTKMESYEQTGETTLVTNEDGRIADGITVKAKDTIGPLLLGTYTVVETDINEANNFEDARSLGVTDESLMNNPNGTRSNTTAPEDTTGGWNSWSAKIPQTTLDINSIPQHNLNITHKKDTNTYTIHTESLYLPNDDASRGREDVRHDVDTTRQTAINDGVEVTAPKNKDNTAVVESTDWEKTGEIEIYKLFERRRDNAIRNDDYKIGENLNPIWGNNGATNPNNDYVGNYKDSSFAEESLIKEGTFSLAGAIIGIYHTRADAEAAQNYWTTSHNGVNPLNTAGFSGIHDAVMGKYNCEACLITDEHGYAISDMNFLFDDYYIVELRAPECGAYEVDPEIHQVTLNVATPYRESAKERIATVELLEQPHLGKFQFQKMLEDAVEYADGSTTDNYGLNDAHIRQLISDKWWYYDQDTGARQPIKFYYYHIGDASKVGANFIHKGVTQVAGNNPTVVINHCARSDGDPRYRYNEKADGSPVSLTAEGLIYGNWYVYEDPATVPDGYQPLTFKIHIEEDRSYIYELNGETYDFDKDQTENEGDEIPAGAKIDDNVKFKLKIHKIDAHTGQEVSLDNAQFQLYENRFNDIYDTDTDDGPAHWIVDDGSANGKVTTTLTTGEDGTVTIVGQCRQDEAGNWVRMSGTPDDPRIYSAGHYTLKEVKTPWHYYTLTSPVQFSILYDKQYVSDDGNQVAGLDYVIAPTSGAYMTIEPDGTEVLNLQLFVKDEPVLGRLKVEKFCAYGGEQVNMEGFEFDIVCAENITDERATANDPHATAYEHPTENDYTYTQTSGGTVTPNDTVANNGDKVGVDGSKYRVDMQTGRILKKGAVADHIVTDANGVAITKDLYLGKYWVRETKSGQYFALDLANTAALTVAKTDGSGNATNYNVVDENALSDYFVELEEDDIYKDGSFVPKTYFAEETYQFYNYPTTLKIGKLDIVATTRQGKEVYLPGATFHIWSEDGVDDWTMTTGPDGFFQMDHDHDHVDDNGKEIPGFRHGAVYHVKETKAPAGYYEDKNEYVFTVNNDGYYEDGTLKTGGHEAQTSRSLDPTTDANPEAGNDDEITDKNREILTLYAKDIAEVARDPKDHSINLRYTLQFIVKDNPQNIYITKSDITDAKRVDDAKLKVIYGDKSGNGVAEGHTAGEVLDEWVTAKSQDAYNENEKLTNSDFFKDRHEIYAVPDGWYTLIEVTAPYGYERAESISFEVVHGMARTYEKMEDKPFRRVFIDKLDMVDGESIAGATLELYADKDIKDVEGNVLVEAGTLIERWVSGENIGIVDNFGEFYNAQNITPPQENLNPVNTSLWDADEDYQEWVSYDKTSTAKSMPHMIALHSGDYKLVEILPPVGYSSLMYDNGEEVRNEVVFTVKETGNGDFDIHKVAMKDERLKLYITKSDITTSAPVPGAQLTITSQDGKIIDQWITGIKPHYIDRIPVGKYTLTETRTPTDRGYVTAESVEFEVTDTIKIQTVDMEDDYTKVQLTKSDITTSEPVIGAELVIKDEEGNEIERWITEVEPHYIERLPVGKYTLTETRTPTDQGYITAESIEFNVSDTGLIQKVDMKDDFTKVKITKSDITNSKLVNGATLVIKDEKGKVIDKWVTDDKPHYIERIPVGKYTLTEITAPDGYEVAETVEFEVDETGEIQLVEMKDAPYRSVDITKTDITNSEEIVGAILVIRDLDGNLVDAWISGQPGGDSNNGAYYGGDTESTPRPESDITNLEGVDITGLKPGPHRVNLHSGKYTLSEYKPADGYTTAETIEFEVIKVTDTDYEVMGLNMTDDVTKVEITKADITDSNPVIGAELIIKDEKGNVVDTWITEETPHYIEKLPIGKYTLTEITAPDGYEVAETVEFEVKDTGEIQKVFMYDSPYRSVDITKTDMTNGEEIPGACLVIRDKDGKLVDAWISGQPGTEDNNGAYYGGDTKSEPRDEEIIEELVKTVNVNDLHAQPHRVNLHSGTYTLSEYKPADGYVTAETITFEVIQTSETDYQVMGVEMKDDVTKVEITKADITDSKPVIGAVLIIEDANDNEIARWVTEKEPHYIEKLPIGKYKLTEITAPQGYNVAETVEFEVLDTGEIQHVFMYDSPTVKTPIPKMGDLLNKRNLIIGGVAILILLILVLLLLKGRKTPKKDDPDDGASEDTAESDDASDEASSEENSSPEE